MLKDENKDLSCLYFVGRSFLPLVIIFYDLIL